MYYIFTHQERESSQNQLLGISMPDFLIYSRSFKFLLGMFCIISGHKRTNAEGLKSFWATKEEWLKND